jgi:hypothetical protein
VLLADVDHCFLRKIMINVLLRFDIVILENVGVAVVWNVAQYSSAHV